MARGRGPGVGAGGGALRSGAVRGAPAEKRKRWDEAAACWRSIGETKKAALCHARYRIYQGRYAEAADAFAEAGDSEAALRTRILAAQIGGDPTGRLRSPRRPAVPISCGGSDRPWTGRRPGEARGGRQVRPSGPGDLRRIPTGPGGAPCTVRSNPATRPRVGPRCAPGIGTD